MTDEERQRQMDFILNNLAQVTAKIDNLADLQKAGAVRINRLEDAFVTLTKLSERIVERLDEHNGRINDVEQAIVQLTKLVDRRNGAS
jgi:DNA repair exonuclease SbcCD ATPase subunit